MIIRSELRGCDWIEAHKTSSGYHLSFQGCEEFESLVARLVNQNPDPSQWPLPLESSHAAVLVREFIQKLQGQWVFPYPHEELCHCRQIPTKTVDQLVVTGTRDLLEVVQRTKAGSGCGTCRSDIKNIIEFRHLKKA